MGLKMAWHGVIERGGGRERELETVAGCSFFFTINEDAFVLLPHI